MMGDGFLEHEHAQLALMPGAGGSLLKNRGERDDTSA